jgi:hypothetical protein
VCVPAPQHFLLTRVPAPCASSSSSKIRVGGRTSNWFDDDSTVKNEAPAANPSACAVNGLVADGWPCGPDDTIAYMLVSNQKSLGGAIRRELSLALFSLALVWFLDLVRGVEVGDGAMEGSEEAGWKKGETVEGVSSIDDYYFLVFWMSR